MVNIMSYIDIILIKVGGSVLPPYFCETEYFEPLGKNKNLPLQKNQKKIILYNNINDST